MSSPLSRIRKCTTLEGNADDNYVYTKSGGQMTVLGGSGDDTLINYDEGAVLIGGDGDDYIYNQTYTTSTINAGHGDDTIDLESEWVSIGAEHANLIEFTL